MTHGVNLAEVSYKKHVLIFFIPFYLMSFTLKILHVRIRLSVKFCLMVFHNMFIIKGCVSIDFRFFFSMYTMKSIPLVNQGGYILSQHSINNTSVSLIFD